MYRRLLSGQKTAAAVIESGKLKGILSLDGISRYFLIQAALREMKAK